MIDKYIKKNPLLLYATILTISLNEMWLHYCVWLFQEVKTETLDSMLTPAQSNWL